MNAIIVAANNKEGTEWLKDIPESWTPFVNDKYNPPGRESYSYLEWCAWYLEHSHAAFEDVVFCQGNPFHHEQEFLAMLDEPQCRYYGTIHECNITAAPAYNAPLSSWCNVLGLQTPNTFRFVAGAQYRVSVEQIRYRLPEFYLAMLNLTCIEYRTPWIYERIWPLIWNITL